MCFYSFHRNSPEWKKKKTETPTYLFRANFQYLRVTAAAENRFVAHHIARAAEFVLLQFYCKRLFICFFLFVFLSLPLIAFAVIFSLKIQLCIVVIICWHCETREWNTFHFLFVFLSADEQKFFIIIMNSTESEKNVQNIFIFLLSLCCCCFSIINSIFENPSAFSHSVVHSQ